MLAGPLLPSTAIPWRRRSAMSLEVRFKLYPEAKHGKSKNLTPHTLCFTKKLTQKLASLHHILPLYHWQRSLPLLPPFSNEHITLWRKTRHLWYQYMKMFTHYLHHYFSEYSFRPPLSTPSSRSYMSWYGLDTFRL